MNAARRTNASVESTAQRIHEAATTSQDQVGKILKRRMGSTAKGRLVKWPLVPTKKGAWVKCSEEEPDCRGVDKLDNVDAVCMERVMKSIGNLRNPDYINAVNSDAWLDSGYLNKKVIRCTTDTDMDYWLDLSGVKDTST